ncbi:MAG: hypothetical protein OYH77_01970 [Pseudomonadota bacterium]|nr:hypothetical protein [Pseudomonadota bacterium]
MTNNKRQTYSKLAKAKKRNPTEWRIFQARKRTLKEWEDDLNHRRRLIKQHNREDFEEMWKEKLPQLHQELQEKKDKQKESIFCKYLKYIAILIAILVSLTQLYDWLCKRKILTSRYCQSGKP